MIHFRETSTLCTSSLSSASSIRLHILVYIVAHHSLLFIPAAPHSKESLRSKLTHYIQTSKLHPSAMAPHLAPQSKPKTSPRSSPKTSPEKEGRTRQQFIIRHTENGWVESEKPKDEDKIKKAAEDTSNIAALEEAFSSDAPRKENVPPNTEATIPTPAIQPQNTRLPEARSTARWQAYADPSGESAPTSKVRISRIRLEID